MKRMSIRRYLTLALLLLGVLPIALFALTFWTALAGHLDDDTEAMARVMLRAVSAEASSRAIEGPRRDLPSILLLTAGEASPERIRDTLRDTKAPRPEYLQLSVLDEYGRVIASYPDANFRDGSIYPMRSRSAAAGVTAFSPPFDSSALGRVVVEASYANGERTAIALLDLEWLSAKLFLAAGSGEDRLGIVWLDGRYIASSDPSRMRSGAAVDSGLLAGPMVRHADSGSDYLVTSEPIPGSEWRAVYFRSRKQAMEPLNEFAFRIAILIFLTVTASTAIAYLSWRRISSPLSALVLKIDTISQGSYDERVGLDLAPEYREIALAINAMAESIERRGRDLEHSERRYRLMFENNGVPALLIGADDGRIRDANPAAIGYYGYGLSEIRERAVVDLDAGSDSSADYAAATSLSTRHRLRSGEVRDVDAFSSPVDISGEAQRYVLVVDVTERRIAEERTEKALEEKTMLLREIYHRVKNNLQIISSLLSMQTSAAAEGRVASELRSARDRVFAMSLAHELVYQMPDISSIAVDDYSYQLLAYLADAYAAPRACLETALEPIRMEMERAIPFGLLLNEIASNAFKYGIRGSLAASIRVTLEKDEAAVPPAVRLVIEDDGPGLPDSVPENALGISIAKGLAAQLKGSAAWDRSRSGGTRVAVIFPLAGHATRDASIE